MHLVDRELAERPLPATIAGFYAIETVGDCPAMPRAIELRQLNYMVEAVADDSLVLFGAVGSSQLFLATNDQRFARQRETMDGGRHQYDVPDAPRSLLKAEAVEPGTPIVLNGVAQNSCTLTLLPAT